MESRNISLTLEKAQEWYNSGSADLKKVALQAFTEEELKEDSFKTIETFGDACCALKLNPYRESKMVEKIEKVSKASAASYKLNIIRKALNKGKKMDFTKSTVWYPYTPAILTENPHYKKNVGETEVGKVKVDDTTYTLLGGSIEVGHYFGLGSFLPRTGEAMSDAFVGFLGCATPKIARHMGKYFGKEIFEAMYGDIIDFEWIW